MSGIERERLVRLMAQAGPPDYRRPLPADWWNGFLHILNTFFGDVAFAGQRVADLGPGHHHLAALLSTAGAHVTGVERDPALAELGRALGHTTVECEAGELTASTLEGPVDGLFSKFALRAFEAGTVAEAESFCVRLDALLKPSGWGWIAPWNGPVDLYEPEQMQAVAGAQIETFTRLGWTHHELEEDEARYLGVHGVTYNRALFTKNLRWTKAPATTWSLKRLRLDPRFAAHSLIEWDSTCTCELPWERWTLQRLLDRLFDDGCFAGKTVVNLGPGVFDFEDEARLRGARVLSVVCRADDAAAGRRNGYTVLEGDPLTLDPDRHGGPVDGLFARQAVNALDAAGPGEVDEVCRRIDRWIKPGGWGCVLPWNRSHNPDPELPRRQMQAFQSLGWVCRELGEDEARSLGIYGRAFNRPLFTRGLAAADWPTTPVFIVADSPAWRLLAERWTRLGYDVALSFNTAYAETLPRTRGALLCIACEGGRPTLPHGYHDAHLPAALAVLRELWARQPQRPLRGRLADGTTVVLVHGRTQTELIRAISELRYESCLDLDAGAGSDRPIGDKKAHASR